ncbi:MAG: Rab family GTPase [Promethearchaeota archaeon]|jgi:small GTP-binding protein
MYDYLFKIVLLGDNSEGKIAFTQNICHNIFNSDTKLTIGVDFFTKQMRVLDSEIRLHLWDIVGDPRFKFLIPTYCSGANAAIIIYDVNNPYSLDHVSEWADIVRSRADDIPIMLIGSKLSSEESRSVPRQAGISAVEQFNLSAYEEICLETGENVDHVFEVLGELLFGQTGIERKTGLILVNRFKINEYLELRLENSKSNIYVKGRLFNQCKYLLFNISDNNIQDYSDITSIDEAAEKLDRSMEREGSNNRFISPLEEFWGHCSNLQAWFENDYDTRILHRNLAFPLLRALMEAGDNQAKNVFKEQLALRLESGHPSVVLFLVKQDYLEYLTKDELDSILDSPKFIKNIPNWLTDFKSLPKRFGVKLKEVLFNLKCPYCASKISRTSIKSFLKNKSLRCEFCCRDFFKNK